MNFKAQKGSIIGFMLMMSAITGAVDAHAKWPKLKTVIAVAVAPMSAPLATEAAKAAKPLVKEAAKATGVDPDAAQKLVDVAANPGPTVVDLTEKTVKYTVKTTGDAVKAHLQLAQAVIDLDMNKAAEAAIKIAGTQVDGALNPGVLFVVKLTLDLIPEPSRNGLMEAPTVELVEPYGIATRGLADPKLTYFVNGMLTTHEEARAEAEALANHLRRPVGLIYNDTKDKQGNKGPEDWVEKAGDGLQAIMDRAYPIRFEKASLPGNLRQPNRTTRQVTHLLHHSRGNLSIVSHSQGCLIVRNALLTASKFRGNGEPEKRVRWTATGTPLRNEEILVTLNLYTPLANKNDSVAQALGVRLLNDEDVKSVHSGHDFVKGYLPRINANRLW